ncbi:DUF6891 domain-containing protein [Actinomadura rugatobispora]|uniref:DUF6891 domain-containing protein n=1 Tax=Actinomadura rugatobispora TaxID=1994 RepID=A0ABW1AE58_9ACTN|nr:hypothetical protein GCM10010200_068550 [Actinomadura rugatobispora]
MVDGSLHSLLREHVRVSLARAEDDFDTIVADAFDLLDGKADRDAVGAVARAEFAAYREEQRAWNGDLLDAERLLAAFRDLDADGVVARADFTCCQSCGTNDIGAEAPAGEAPAGYVFCHRQDVDAAARGEGLFLSYGAFSEGGDDAEIGRRAVRALRERGLTVEWDGEVTTRIHLPLTWRRRRYAHLARSPGGPDDEGGSLAVTYCDYTRDRAEDEPITMSFEDFRGLLYELVPAGDNFITCEGRSGQVVQGMWEEGPRFWLETPDPGARCSYGRWATLDEAAEVVRALAEDDRVALTDLGDLETVVWS